LIGHPSMGEKGILVKALWCFFLYSLILYLVIFTGPHRLKKVYLTSLFLDLIFLSILVHAETSFENSFFLGYYLLICLHTVYFGVRFGLLVAVFSAVCYLVSVFPMLVHIEWTDLAIRITFFFFITVPVGLLTEKVKRDKDKVEHFNRTLEGMVAQRTQKIGILLGQERYLRSILDTVAQINKLLITSPNLDSLLADSCVRFVQHSHYDFCWIGLLADDRIETVYTPTGEEDSLLPPPYDPHREGSPFYRSSVAECIRDNRTVIHFKDGRTPDTTPWRNPAEQRGFQAVVSLPLRPRQSAPPLGVLTIYTLRTEGFEPEERDMLDELAGDIGFAIDSFRQRESVTKLTAERTANYEETIFSFADMIEQRDTYTAGHTERVAHYCLLLAREMGLGLEEKKKLYKAAILHDIGKVATPDSVLLKPGKLTELDYDLIKVHAFAGYEMLSQIEMYKELAVIIQHHHERYDGTGYPDGLKGEEIPLLSRIMAVGDAFDAMTTNRIYKPKKEIGAALAELRSCSGSQFDPEVVRGAVKVLADVSIAPAINQLPVTKLEKKRFSYFFNDKLTGLYNEDYLKIILNNRDVNQYRCLHLLHLQNVPEYNKLQGWDKGDLLLKDFAAELQAALPEALLFRAYGNDFAAIAKEHLQLDGNVFNGFACLRDTGITVEVQHLDLGAGIIYTIDKQDRLEIHSLVAPPVKSDPAF
ncbi:MAG: HD domain-containing protein, partial [Desulfobulbaceae bacterium]|nr:HD domain-containing protein [Desulfobulbaceae bacterium]